MRLITAGISYYGQEPYEAFFGLAGNTLVDEIRIEWPDGTVTLVEDVTANQVITITNDTLLNNTQHNTQQTRLYPNPVKDKLTITSTQSLETIKVFDILGQKVASKNVASQEITLDLNKLSSGNYFVQIVSEGNISETYHILKN